VLQFGLSLSHAWVEFVTCMSGQRTSHVNLFCVLACMLSCVLMLTCHVYQFGFHSGLLTRIFCEGVVSPILATCTVYLILDLIILRSGETYNFETLLYVMHQDLFYTAT
jgi:hypothetical protein